MTTFSNIGKIAYIYDEASDTWYPVAGMTDTSADVAWSGEHDFSGVVSFTNSVDISGNLVLNGSFNFFTSTTARDAVITSPQNGMMALVVESNTVRPQYYYNGAWRLFGNNAYLETKTSNYTIALSDAGKTLEVNGSTGITITVPLDSAVNFPVGAQIGFIQAGAGQIIFAGQAGTPTSVTIYSKNNNKKTSSQYTQAILVKKTDNIWYLFGDLTA